MRTILVPTDFSPSAENALRFAILLAKEQHAGICLLHVYSPPMALTIAEFDMVNAQLVSLKGSAEKSLHRQSQEIARAGDVTYECCAVEGAPVHEIVAMIKEKNADLVIMGTKGQTNVIDSVLGTNTANVIAKATCPVIAVPESFSFRNLIRKITYATDYARTEAHALRFLVQIAQPLKAHINIVHVSDNFISPEKETAQMGAFIKKMEPEIQYANLSFQIIQGKEVEKRLMKHLKESRTDLLAMSTQVRKFFDRIFGQSISRQVVQHSEVPVIVFHHHKEAAITIY